ncbi:MAG: hypothetical protein Q8N04_09495 [Nitrospira sp.]|nr:hypothetical protein [Nitrospira sp.]
MKNRCWIKHRARVSPAIALVPAMAIMVSLTVSPIAYGQFVTIEAPPTEAKDAAVDGLATLKAIVKNDDPHAMQLGFVSAAEVMGLTPANNLGLPLPVYWVRLDKLAQFCLPGAPCPTAPQRAKAVIRLLEPFREFIYPISVGIFPRSSLTVVRPDPQDHHTWLTTEWGSERLIKKMMKLRKGECLVVSILGLNRHFLAGMPAGAGDCGPQQIRGDLLTLRALEDDAILHIAEGDTINAWQAFSLMRTLADTVNKMNAPY